MSRTPYFFVERYDGHTNKYELQHPIIWNWNHTEKIRADLYPYNGDHDLFSIVEDNRGNFPSMHGIHHGLPAGVNEKIRKEFDECSYDTEWSDKPRHIEPEVRWFTYADMYIYCLEHPEAVDYEAMDRAYYNGEENDPHKKIMMPTPLKSLMNRVDAFLEVMDGWDWRDDYSQIRIVYWIE
jgi:hypothetical protein